MVGRPEIQGRRPREDTQERSVMLEGGHVEMPGEGGHAEMEIVSFEKIELCES